MCGDLRQRREHEGSVRQLQMRHSQPFFFDHFNPEQQDIDIDLARAPARPFAAPQLPFDSLDVIEQRARRHAGSATTGGVVVGQLILWSHRRRLVERRNGIDAHRRLNAAQRGR